MSVEAACRCAVPLFVMLSGALLLDPSRLESPNEFYRKRFWRIGIPLVFWSLFYTLPRAAANGFSGAVMAETGWKLAYGRPAYHIYFLFVIAGLYLATPYLRTVIRRLTSAELRNLWIALILLAWGGGLLCLVYGYQHTVLTEFVPYVGYYVAGYELRRSRLSNRGMWIASMLIGLAIALMVIVTTPLVDRFGVTDRTRYLYDYFSPTVIVVSVCLFLIMLTAFDRPSDGMLGTCVALTAPATLGIFLMHPALGIALEQAQKRGLVPVWDVTVPSLLLSTVVVFLVCLGLTSIGQRIPIVRNVFG